MAVGDGLYPWLVATNGEDDGGVIAYAYATRFRERPAPDPGIEEIGRFGQRGRRNAGRQGQHAVLDLAVFADQHHQRAFRLQPHELDMLQPRIGFGGQHHRGGPGQARQPRQRFAECGFDRLRAADGSELVLDRLALRFGEVADLHQGIDEKP